MQKLFVLSRSDLPVGLAAAQAVHAALEWAISVGEERVREWMADSNTVVLLSVDQGELDMMSGLPGAHPFVDPDLGQEKTSLAFDPGSVQKRKVSRFPLLGQLAQPPKPSGQASGF